MFEEYRRLFWTATVLVTSHGAVGKETNEAWEAWERQSGHIVRTPRIPGLTYRDLGDID